MTARTLSLMTKAAQALSPRSKSPVRVLLPWLLLLPCAAWAQPAGALSQAVRDLPPERAERLKRALSLSGGDLVGFKEQTGNTYDNLLVGILWKVDNEPIEDASGWSLYGRLGFALVKNPSFVSKLKLQNAFRFLIGSRLNNITAYFKFIYDRRVHVRYLRGTRTLRVVLEDAQELSGSFNFAFTQTISSSTALDTGFGLSAGSLSTSIGVDHERSELTFAVAGLPYRVRPVFGFVEEDGFLRLRLGYAWECQITLQGQTQGVATDSGRQGRLGLKWGLEREVDVEARVSGSQREQDGWLRLKTEGQGISAWIAYDERMANQPYEAVIGSDLRWHLDVSGTAALRVGSIHETRRAPRAPRKKWLGMRIDRAYLPSWVEPPGEPRVAAVLGENPDASAWWSSVLGRYVATPAASSGLAGGVD